VSNFGAIKSYKQSKAGRLLSLKKNHKGYLEVRLQDADGAQAVKFVHRLVLTVFAPVKGMENLTVDHIDGNPENNHISNLRWMTAEENLSRATKQEGWGQHSSSIINSLHGKTDSILHADTAVQHPPILFDTA
jgi:hypothetical protein